MSSSEFLQGNANRKCEYESWNYFGLRTEPDEAIKEFWNRRSTYEIEDDIFVDARDLHERENRSVQSTFVLGHLLFNRKKNRHEEKEGKELLCRAAQRGLYAAGLILGQRSFGRGMYKDALQYWSMASASAAASSSSSSSNNDGQATCALARLYRDGLAVEQDRQYAEDLYRKAIKEGCYYEALNNLAVLIMNKSPMFFPLPLDDQKECEKLFTECLRVDHTSAFTTYAHYLTVFDTNPNKKKNQQADALLRIAHARREPRAADMIKRRNIKPLDLNGTQILDDDPYGTPVCAACLVMESDVIHLNKCSQCKVTTYCSKICQKVDWRARHRILCGKMEPMEDESVSPLVIQVEAIRADVGTEQTKKPQQSEHPLEVGATATLINSTYEKECKGRLINFDKSLGRWKLSIEPEDGSQNVHLMALPENILVCKPAPPRDDNGNIILKRNEGGFVEDEHYLHFREKNERAEREGFRHFLPPPDSLLCKKKSKYETYAQGVIRWTREEENEIQNALGRFARSCSPGLIVDEPDDDEDDEAWDRYYENCDAFAYGWPESKICGESYCGPHYCSRPACFGRNRNQCICEFCCCGYIAKMECCCGSEFWALASTLGWDDMIRTVHLPETRHRAMQMAKKVHPELDSY